MVHTGEVQGSIPCASTTQIPLNSRFFAFLDFSLLGSCRQFQVEPSSNTRGKSGDFVRGSFASLDVASMRTFELWLAFKLCEV